MAQLLRQLALVSEAADISFSDLTRTSAALQKQATRDFGPVWEVQATADAFDRLEDVPLGYWPIIVRDDIGQPGAVPVGDDGCRCLRLGSSGGGGCSLFLTVAVAHYEGHPKEI